MHKFKILIFRPAKQRNDNSVETSDFTFGVISNLTRLGDTGESVVFLYSNSEILSWNAIYKYFFSTFQHI